MVDPLTLRGAFDSAVASVFGAACREGFSRFGDGSSRLSDGSAASRTRTSCHTGRSSMRAVSDGLSFLNEDKVRTFLSSFAETSVPPIENLSFTMYSANHL